MRFTIDTEEVKKRGISRDVFFHILGLYFGVRINEDTGKEANKLGLNVSDMGSYTLSIEGRKLVERVFSASQVAVGKSRDDYKDLAKEMAMLFPVGQRDNSHTPWRGSTEEVADRLLLLDSYAEHRLTKDNVLKATRQYVSSFGDSSYFMQTLPNFIFKSHYSPDGDFEWHSSLLSVMENME